MITTLQKEYEKRCQTRSDMVDYMPVLKKYAEKCDHVTEFGVWEANSSVALLAGLPKVMRSYDIRVFDPSTTQLLNDFSSQNNIDFEFKQQSSLKEVIDQTDLLMIDSLHMYDHLIQELKMHHSKVAKYIIFHDTSVCALQGMQITGEMVPEQGLVKAITEFIENHSEWEIIEEIKNWPGLTVLGKM